MKEDVSFELMKKLIIVALAAVALAGSLLPRHVAQLSARCRFSSRRRRRRPPRRWWWWLPGWRWFSGGGGFRGGGGRGPLTVELAKVYKTPLAEEITVVGNLIGDATVVGRATDRRTLQELSVRLGDRVNRGQRLAKIEDFEIVEQVKQAEAAQEVSQATIRQREADLQLAETNVERSRSLFERQLLPKQTLDDNEARYQAALAQLDLARAQTTQSKARLDELRINLANTVITSPVNGFVAKRNVDPGAFVSQQAPVADVVDITRVRLVANVVEKDLKELETGNQTRVEVDAYPGETFSGRIARVSPVLDPATRTAPIEIEIPNPAFRLKPGDVCPRRHHHADEERGAGPPVERRRRSGRPPRRVSAAERHRRLPHRAGGNRAGSDRRDSGRPEGRRRSHFNRRGRAA